MPRARSAPGPRARRARPAPRRTSLRTGDGRAPAPAPPRRRSPARRVAAGQPRARRRSDLSEICWGSGGRAPCKDPSMRESEYLSSGDVAQILGVSREYVVRLDDRLRPARTRMGQRIYRRDAVETFRREREDVRRRVEAVKAQATDR